MGGWWHVAQAFGGCAEISSLLQEIRSWWPRGFAWARFVVLGAPPRARGSSCAQDEPNSCTWLSIASCCCLPGVLRAGGGPSASTGPPPVGHFAQHGAALGCPARSEPWSRGLRKSVGAGCALPRRAAIKATAFCRTRGGNVRPLPSHTKNFASNREARASPGTTRGLPSPAWEPLVSAQLPRNRSSG